MMKTKTAVIISRVHHHEFCMLKGMELIFILNKNVWMNELAGWLACSTMMMIWWVTIMFNFMKWYNNLMGSIFFLFFSLLSNGPLGWPPLSSSIGFYGLDYIFVLVCATFVILICSRQPFVYNSFGSLWNLYIEMVKFHCH
mgnify:CR=1 FL=1